MRPANTSGTSLVTPLSHDLNPCLVTPLKPRSFVVLLVSLFDWLSEDCWSWCSLAVDNPGAVFGLQACYGSGFSLSGHPLSSTRAARRPFRLETQNEEGLPLPSTKSTTVSGPSTSATFS